ncbi:MAG: serine/threonine protein kinase [Bdellovibrionales bacterium]|nr:serine/threonine protein kinase [Bdellovibrionales bacterium]
MAEIYRAVGKTATHEERLIAIKRILPEYSSDDEFISLLKDEAKLMVYLNHPNIVPIVEFGKVVDQYYIAMEYIEGTTLKGLLQKIRSSHQFFTIDMAVHIIREIATGLGYAHRKTDKKGNKLHIVHRDISPSNILLSFDGEVKVADFGISKAQTQTHRTQVGIIRGKTGYMSPEQAQSGTKIDHRSDLFSLGIIFYELLTGRRLFQSESIPEALKLAREAKVEPISSIRPDIPIELEKIVLKILRKDPDDRFQVAEDIVDKLNEFLSRFNPKGRPIRITHMDLVGFLGRYFREEMAKSSSVYLGLYDQIFSVIPKKAPQIEGGNEFGEALVTNPFFEMSQAERLLDKATSSVITDEVEPAEDPEKTDAQDDPHRTKSIDEVQESKNDENDDKVYAREGDQASTERRLRKLSLPNYEFKKKKPGGMTFNIRVTKQKFFWVLSIVFLIFSGSFFLMKYVVEHRVKKEVVQKSLAVSDLVLLTVQSEPSQADIYIDGILQDYKTPRVFELEYKNNLNIEVRKEGYQPDRRVLQSPEVRETLDFVLLPISVQAKAPESKEPSQMSLDLYSSPQGAEVFVDGASVSKKTPTTVVLELGRSYNISVQLDGYESVQELIEATQATSIEKTFALKEKDAVVRSTPTPEPAKKDQEKEKKLVKKGALNVSSTPWANVIINDKVLGQTPLIGYKLAEGSYEMILTNEDLQLTPAVLRVRVRSNQRTTCVYQFSSREGQCK